MRLGRRRLLVGSLVFTLGAACGRVSPRAEPVGQPTESLETLAWQASATALLADARASLRTFEDFAAYRVSITPDSGLRPAASLLWDPPTGLAWDNASHVSRNMQDRANQLFLAITTASIDPALWRTQRDMADAAHDLIDLGSALRAYRDRIDRVAPGDAGGALELLDTAWKQFDAVAARWGTARSEPVGCSSDS